MIVPTTVTVSRGSLHLPRELFERYFPGLEAVILLRRDDDLDILPVHHAAAGGYLLKRRNAAGDRVVNAADFFRREGIDDEAELRLPVSWRSDRACLSAASAFVMQR